MRRILPLYLGALAVTVQAQTVDVSIGNKVAGEADGFAVVEVSLSAASSEAISVDWQTSDRQAVSPADYAGGSGTLVIPAGETSGSISIALVDDNLDEPSEKFFVDLDNLQGPASFSDSRARVTISDNDDDALSWDSIATGFQSLLALDSGRYVVQEGSWLFHQIDECFTSGKNCLGNNPSSQYGYARFPNREWEWRRSIGGVPGYMVGNDEAVVLILQTPPTSHYFGLTPNVHSRYSPTPGNDSLRSRIAIGGSYADSLNQLALGAAPVEGASPYPFDRTTAVIFSPNQMVSDELTQQLTAAGLPAEAINVIGIPVGAVEVPLYTGYANEADEFCLLMRVSIPDDQQALTDWAQQLPIASYRVAINGADFVPFAYVPYKERFTGRSEYDLLPGIEARRDALVEAIKLRHAGASPLEYRRIEASPRTGLDCINDEISCGFDNQDALYERRMDFPRRYTMTSDPENFWYFVGVNHRRTGKALYTNHSVYIDENSAGVAGITDFRAAGSAAYYAAAFADGLAIGDFEDLYVLKMARQCESEELDLGYCVEVPYPTGENPVGATDTDALYTLTRLYLDSESKVGPDLAEVVTPVFLMYE
ncbi:Calx-beta domain-containing protein [Mangrovimicrobium sediminis]|uniref:Calx-beta domain-containing protein n=1 Tax=Mangrovimicrobium sediminis TaxID=2562682 RepID=UPI001436A843|nr:Calx-beta domain-containing protein [Haliea sp. SAOS-164]